jgi:hypothetical protein
MSRTDQEQPRWGEIEFTWKDGGTPGIKFDRLAHSGRRELLMFSCVAEAQRIKQIRAALCASETTKSQVRAIAAGVQTNVPGREAWYANTPGTLVPTSDGYVVHTHKLGFGMAHALFVTKAQGFMMVVTADSLWRELNTTRFTTPLLKEWVPYIEKRLRADNLLEDALVFNCTCGILSATTSKLDEIVTDGLKKRLITIPDQDPALAVA